MTAELIKRLAQILGADVKEISDRREARAYFKDDQGAALTRPRVEVPLKDHISDLAVAMHELGEIILNGRATDKNWPLWRSEAAASKWAVLMIDSEVMPEVPSEQRQACRGVGVATLRRSLATYVQDAVDQGWDAEEVRRGIDPELWTEPTRAPSDEELRGLLAGPRV